MLFGFKKYLETLDSTAVITSAVGMAISSACGVSALYNTCSGYSDGCNNSVPVINPSILEISSVASLSAIAGTLCGYSLGLLTTHIIEPIGNEFVGWAFKDLKRVPDVIVKDDNLDIKHNKP